MSKRHQKETKNGTVLNGDAENAKNAQNASIQSFVGSSNVKRWNKLKCLFECKTNEEFASLLLDFAETHIDGKVKAEPVSANQNGFHEETIVASLERLSEQDLPIQNETKETENDMEIDGTELAKYNDEAADSSFFNGDSNIVHSEFEITNSTNLNDEQLKEEMCDDPGVQDNLEVANNPSVINKSRKLRKRDSNKNKKIKAVAKKEKTKKKIDIDIRKAPEFNIQDLKPIVDNFCNITSNVKKERFEEQSDSTAQSMCPMCRTQHVAEDCPFEKPLFVISDSLNYERWKENLDIDTPQELKAESLQCESETSNDPDLKSSYSFSSLPQSLCFQDTNSDHGLAVFAKNEIVQYTQFGPVIGRLIKEVDIPEDCTMRDLWEISTEDKNHIYLSTEDLNQSNWLRFVRPAPTRNLRNLCAISRYNQMYLFSTRIIENGEELLYWQEDVVVANKKKLEKTACGGCNMNFAHSIYYRLHCSIFHDLHYSLTIRKYHCKVCGEAILGKENIMKHAMELHNGRGAYQCQFCKKFFLRLNYLEMHRTYGCSANPNRTKPLCDHCGRKFCQPQKLKVHIMRMHGDMSVVLKEFQCKTCLKLLGSRAALQRHLKEVHEKQVTGSCACNKCGKLFQNKSNLKIHMLTHSGIKPFKCAEQDCAAAFTTKQCLQFHYKKVHGMVEDKMPKIERSVDYTFEAYSGVEDQINAENGEIAMIPGANSRRSFPSGSEADETSLEGKNTGHRSISPNPVQTNDNSSSSDQSQPSVEQYTTPPMKMLTKGSKKWIASDLDVPKNDLYQVEKEKQKPEMNVVLDMEEQHYDHSKMPPSLSTFTRQESSNASLLVEAALDSVCSEPNMDIDVNSTTNCTDALVNNLYTLSHADTLPDVPYSHSVDMNESRDLNLISPSVNDHISVTDDLNDELRHSQNIDYSFHQEDFSPPNSPTIQSRHNFVRQYINDHVNSPDNQYGNLSKNVSRENSPHRYDFGQNINTDHISSDDSNGLGVQNLSVQKDNAQLDLTSYKAHYCLDTSFQFRKDFRQKIETENDRKQFYFVGMDGTPKLYDEIHKFNIDGSELDLQSRSLSESVQEQDKHKDLEDLRKNYDIEADLRNRATYEIDDFRIKNYDLVDNLESRNSLESRSLLEADFRTDRSFDHLLLNPEMQGLDMSARPYHNYPNMRYHHLYSDGELRLNYNSPSQNFSHDILRAAVSLDLTTPPTRHSTDLSLRTHQISNSRILADHMIQPNHRLSLDQSRLLPTELTAGRHISPDTRLLSVSDMSNRILSDHSTNRLLTNDTSRLLGTEQRLLTEEGRLITEQPRLLDQGRILGDSRILPPNSGTISPPPYAGYPVSPTSYHPTALPQRPHVSTSPNPPYHYPAYY